MKVMSSMFLASILTIGSAFANVTVAKEISPAKSVDNIQMNSQQELVDLFFAAAKIGNSEVINEFLKHGFPVDVRNKDGYTPLMMATFMVIRILSVVCLNMVPTAVLETIEAIRP